MGGFYVPVGMVGFLLRKWHLATSNPRDPIRQWIDKQTALSELAAECWTISGPYPKRAGFKADLRQRFHGYALTRIVLRKFV